MIKLELLYTHKAAMTFRVVGGTFNGKKIIVNSGNKEYYASQWNAISQNQSKADYFNNVVESAGTIQEYFTGGFVPQEVVNAVNMELLATKNNARCDFFYSAKFDIFKREWIKSI